MPGRSKNFRITIVPLLQNIGTWRQVMTNAWKPPGLRWFADDDGVARWHREVRRRSDVPALEYPENNPEELERLMKYCSAIASTALHIEELAAQRLAEVRKEQTS